MMSQSQNVWSGHIRKKISDSACQEQKQNHARPDFSRLSRLYSLTQRPRPIYADEVKPKIPHFLLQLASFLGLGLKGVQTLAFLSMYRFSVRFMSVDCDEQVRSLSLWSLCCFCTVCFGLKLWADVTSWQKQSDFHSEAFPGRLEWRPWRHSSSSVTLTVRIGFLRPCDSSSPWTVCVWSECVLICVLQYGGVWSSVHSACHHGSRPVQMFRFLTAHQEQVWDLHVLSPWSSYSASPPFKAGD